MSACSMRVAEMHPQLGAERRRAVQARVLKHPLVLFDQCLREL